MKKRTFKFLSADKSTKIHAVKWEPEEGKIKAILQISHGMVEYVERYDEFAKYLTQQGILVVGNDHLGHGESVKSQELWGYFAPNNGSNIVIKDLNRLRAIIQKEYPEIPYFMLGHSMGSFLLRKYLSIYGVGLQGAIIMGTGTQPDAAVKFGKVVCKFLAIFRGWKYRSRFINRLAFAGNEKRFRKENLSHSFLTKDKKIIDAYNKEPKCNFIFTLNGFYNLFDTIHYINQSQNINAIPKNLPLFLVSGEEDPVGNYGVGVKTAYEAYKRAGIKDINWKLYPTDRHEILNETDKDKVYKDIYQWIEERI
ncbi:MAG: lysophospholipase [Lachnospiraceae bacterium]